MSPASHPPLQAPSHAPRSLLAAFFAVEPSRRRQRGQGLVEYALILVLIAIATIGAVSMVGQKTSQTFENVNCSLKGGEWRTDNGNGNSSRCTGLNGNGNGNP